MEKKEISDVGIIEKFLKKHKMRMMVVPVEIGFRVVVGSPRPGGSIIGCSWGNGKTLEAALNHLVQDLNRIEQRYGSQ